jgi:hypothetical protein
MHFDTYINRPGHCGMKSVSRFEDLTAVDVASVIFASMTLCSMVGR